MVSKLIPIGDPSECYGVSPSSCEVVNLLRRESPRLFCLSIEELYWEGGRVPWKERCLRSSAVPLLKTKGGGISNLYDLKDPIGHEPSNSALTEVDQITIHDSGLVGRQIGPNVSDFDPRSLVHLKVVPKVVPLEVSDARIRNHGNDSESLQYPPPVQSYYFFDTPFPPWRGLIAGLLGILAIGWGWRDNRGLPWSLLAFLAGIFLFAYACLIVLPWLADQQF